MGRLFWKIFLAFWLTLVAAVIGTGAAIWFVRHAGQNDSELGDGMAAVVLTSMAASLLRHGGAEAVREWMNEAIPARPFPVLVVDRRGVDLLGREVPAPAFARARELVSGGTDSGAVRSVATPGGETYLLFVPLRIDRAQLAFPVLMVGARRFAVVIPIMWVAAGAVSSLLVSALLAWYLTRPVRSLKSAVNAIARGDLDTRVGPSMGRRSDELAELGRDFDRMAAQLQQLVTAQRRLLHDVSHELRSPLARLQAALGLLRQDPHRLDASLERIEREVSRVDMLVGEVLTLARLESATESVPSEAVDLGEIVAAVAEDARFEAQSAGRYLACRVDGHVLVRGSSELLHRAVENVVRNAVKHTDRGTTVEVELWAPRDAPLAALSVSDRGPGMPPEQLAKIFEPFYRGEAWTGHGFGLGMAIAKRAVAAHGGTIRASNLVPHGLRVEMLLPMIAESSQANAPSGSAA